jgi:DoxX-like family
MALAMERHLEEVLMQSASQAAPASAARRWTGRVLSGLPVLFLVFDSVIKLLNIVPVQDAMHQLGYPLEAAFAIGLIEFVSVVLYAIPRTSVLGAVLLTAHLGGAIASHVRIESPLFTHTLFPIYVAGLLWGGLYLREDRLRALLPFRR